MRLNLLKADFSVETNYMCKWRFYLNGTVMMTSRSLERMDNDYDVLAWQQESGAFSHFTGALTCTQC